MPPGEGDGERDGTLSHFEESWSESLVPSPQLFVGLDCERPLATTLRASLSEVEEVGVGRARERRVERVGGRLDVRLTDRWMSAAHARLLRDDGSWSIEDSGSKNGTFVNGSSCRKAVLNHGDIIEVGHTLLLYREALVPELPRDVSADELLAPVSELATFLVPLARQFRALVQVAGRAHVSVMISGETGTGKEVVARTVHRLSGRQGAFIAVNCGSIPAGLFEAELFGCKKGAFTGATDDRPGLIRAADGGTLFLDEIGDLPEAAQTSLLRVLQEHEVLPLGAVKPVPVDLRVVTATHRDLQALAEKGRFRTDLHSRLAGFHVVLPSLEERREDMGMLIAAILRRVVSEPESVTFTPRAARALFRYGWPLNIRELEKCLITAAALAGEGAVDVQHLPDGVRAALNAPVVPPPAASVEPAELTEEDRELRERLVGQLRDQEGNVAAVARAMGKAPMQIHRWIKKYGLVLQEFRRNR